MRVCSFLPAATNIIEALGLSDLLCGVSFECPIDRPRVVRSRLEGEKLGSAEIDRRVKASKAQGESLYYLDEPLLQSLQPDLVFIQDICQVCQIDTATALSALHRLPAPPNVVALNPTTLDDVLDDIEIVALALKENERGEKLLETLNRRIRAVGEKSSWQIARSVSFVEWIKPLYHCGHWIPEQIAVAGGYDRFGIAGKHSSELEWKALRECDPEILIISPCGFDASRAAEEARVLEDLPGWSELSAVQAGEVYAVDSRFFTEPGPNVVSGIEILAALFHPEQFQLSDELSAHVRRVAPTSSQSRKTPRTLVAL